MWFTFESIMASISSSSIHLGTFLNTLKPLGLLTLTTSTSLFSTFSSLSSMISFILASLLATAFVFFFLSWNVLFCSLCKGVFTEQANLFELHTLEMFLSLWDKEPKYCVCCTSVYGSKFEHLLWLSQFYFMMQFYYKTNK